ncbi:sulfurtransferase FdhD [Nocardioides sp. HDW12B]|uniref:formate dehydrogenase accessory sulfurtransferase FdhD n=1 Tax=Nocardioides sp. HDW12B TaxID=2714939 RepID=UPI00140DD3FE|nr:formate dehydrogenase accessory sulfurtransferase FdhD [Nocardioides sp. HDW12B]QIK66474.1 sulfurtransferase FdhD [Nocardioides sp. HDW12B]
MKLARRPGPTVRVRVREYAEGRWRSREDRLATEEPLEIRLAWPGRPAERIGVTMRTPGHDFELAAGMMAGQGVLAGTELSQVAYCTDVTLAPEEEFNVVTVTLAAPPLAPPSVRASTVLATSSACGVCGTESIDEVLTLAGRRSEAGPPGSTLLTPELLQVLPERLREHQRVFASTGGLHAAAAVDATGRLSEVREDIGRHNAMDKVIGARVLTGQDPGVPVMLVSGRIGFELVQKAAVTGIGALVAIGAPSSLAVRLAQEAGVGLVGFLSARRFVVYVDPAPTGV